MVEVIELCQFPLGPNDVRAAEQIPRTGPDFPVNHMIVCLRIPLHEDFPNAELFALHHPHFDINRIVCNARLNRYRLEGQVPVILIERTQIHALGIHVDPGFQPLEVVDFTALDAENGVQLGAAVLGVSGE